MPAKAGIHEFLWFFVCLLGHPKEKKSWIPAFAGMTGEGAVRVSALPRHPQPAYGKGFSRLAEI